MSILIGYFDDEERVLGATRAAREAGYQVHDVYTPYAVHGMDEAMGLRRSRLTWVCFFAGLTGGSLGLSLQYYTSVVSWPLNVGGKPFASWPAFIPVTFELTVLIAALTTVAALFIRTRLFPGSSAEALPRVTDDRFALALKVESTQGPAREVLQQHGAVEVVESEVAP